MENVNIKSEVIEERLDEFKFPEGNLGIIKIEELNNKLCYDELIVKDELQERNQNERIKKTSFNYTDSEIGNYYDFAGNNENKHGEATEDTVDTEILQKSNSPIQTTNNLIDSHNINFQESLEKQCLDFIDEKICYVTKPLEECKIGNSQSVLKLKSPTYVHIQTKKLFKCNNCNYKGTRKRYLVNHMKIHSGEKHFQCNKCNYKCTRKHNLIRHMTTHIFQKLFECNICNYKCTYKEYLVRHIMRVHSCEKPFECNNCDYKSAMKEQLVYHMKTHSGKPFECSNCNYKSARKDLLVCHMRTHSGELFECSICNYKGVRKDNLVRHMKTHT